MGRRKSKMNSFTEEEDKIITENKGGVAAVAKRLNKPYKSIANRKARLKYKDSEGEPLTKEEQEILELVSDGETCKMISEQLNISVRTIEWKRQLIVAKIGGENLNNAIKLACRKG
ncbi:MAG: helix-turn-helix transcriptional regulator, partial [Vicingaceae bacterium]|nr:helix-turn-helix transcriptional regulator [Vicingaceae bacterium]